MVRGAASAIIGQGDVAIIGAVDKYEGEFVGILELLQMSSPLEPGEDKAQIRDKIVDNGQGLQVLFKDTEGLDIVIEQLQAVKQLLIEERVKEEVKENEQSASTD